MKIRAIKTTHGDYGHLPRGATADVNDSEARELIAQGYAIEVLPLDKQEAAQNSDNDNDPFDAAHQIGGLTGADVPPSLSRVDQAHPISTLTSHDANMGEMVAGSASSQSTTDTDSARGQTSSTPATTTGGKRKRGRPRSKG